MLCNFTTADDKWTCTACGRIVIGQFTNLIANCRVAKQGDPPPQSYQTQAGPGTELKKILASLGASVVKECTCELLAAQMNHWGIAGCREHRAEIVEHLEKAAGELGRYEQVKAMLLAFATGIAWSIDIADPFGSLVDQAIKQASVPERQIGKDASDYLKSVSSLPST